MWPGAQWRNPVHLDPATVRAAPFALTVDKSRSLVYADVRAGDSQTKLAATLTASAPPKTNEPTGKAGRSGSRLTHLDSKFV
jgi:hypothetical protein